MRITAVETLRPSIQPNVCLLQLHTDVGQTGIGEAFFAASAVEAYLHDTVAPVILGTDDLLPQQAASRLAPYTGYQGGGVETRAIGAVDLALWDLLGKRAGLPVADLLGGAVRPELRVYNTCAGPGYVRTSTRQEMDNWGIGAGPGAAAGRQYEDLDAFLNRPGELAKDLRADGVTAMKVWPFDSYAERSNGTAITDAELARGLSVLEQIRSAAGAPDMDVMVELHGLWNRPCAERICTALAPYRPLWVEDPIRPDAVDALAALRRAVDVPIATGETVTGRRGFLPLLQQGAIDVVTVDIGWTGGITEARKIATLADTFGVPVAPHDCTGPVAFAACCHVVLSQPNGMIQETVRAFLRTWYAELVEGLPEVADGVVRLGSEAGLGVRLVENLAGRPGVSRRVTGLED
ncbi:mandelate racemase/muconate lactonizing enzyme family protein [Actinopolymorpha sp. B17G11]|uniref:mandelate racemase/muconate lactonizing enzyme family protein n=1 Tax=unclassified Actinopolymorpha TaxID=2627063 RepID=UPI0032D9964E